MRLMSAIRGEIESLFRVALPDSKGDMRLRAVQQQDMLDRLRTMPEFGVLLDHLDGEVRVYIRKLFAAGTEAEAIAIWREMRAFLRIQNRLEMGVTAKAKGLAEEEAYIRRQTELMKADQLHGRQNLEAKARQGQNGRP